MLRIKILPAFLCVVPGAVAAVVACSSVSAAEECRKNPGASAPAGGHWYYRINHVTHQQCWYLSSEGAHVSAHFDASADANGRGHEATPPHAPRDDTAAAAAAAPRPPLQVQPAFMPVAGAGIVAPIPQVDFTARWPGDLPSASDLNDNAPTAASDSYAEPSPSAGAADAAAAADGATPAAQQWPVNDEASASARKASPAAILLGYFSLAGALAIPVLLVAGWLAKFTRAAGRFRVGERRRASPERPAQPRQRVAEADRAPSAAKSRRGDPMRGGAGRAERSTVPARSGDGNTWQPLTPTDPARDLKTSLAELMHDLRRAAASEGGSLTQPTGPPSGQRRRTLEAAE